MMSLSDQQVVNTYRKRAKHYDISANLYYLLGYREWKYRHKTIDALDLKAGDTVVDIGCGTGLNFSRYQEDIGPQGTIIGVDLTDAMLAEAQNRVAKNGWQNVVLVRSNALTFQFPAGIDAAISTFALSIIPDFDQVLGNATAALVSGGRLALLELQIPERWPAWMAALAQWLMSPFAVTTAWIEDRPWETIRQSMQQHLTAVQLTEYYLGLTYIIAGEKA